MFEEIQSLVEADESRTLELKKTTGNQDIAEKATDA